jgi:epoxyqueuosine reductase
LNEWLAKGFHGDMNYMSRHAELRAHPEILQPGAVRALCVRMDYLPPNYLNSTPSGTDSTSEDEQVVDWQQRELGRLQQPDEAVIALYARGRDYHKVMRAKLQQLSDLISQKIGSFGYRAFVESAPVMEVELAKKSGIGWRGKHTLALHREGGSMFFLGEVLIDLPLPVDEPIEANCGSCQACIDICPTKAIVGPYNLDARRCISYLTIEYSGAIPIEFRPLMGNRIYGCDDCQLACPWNKFAKAASEIDFEERNQLGSSRLLELFVWTEEDFLKKHEGSAIRRIGYDRWIRNIAVALGNALNNPSITNPLRMQITTALKNKHIDASPMVKEHIEWALQFKTPWVKSSGSSSAKS